MTVVLPSVTKAVIREASNPALRHVRVPTTSTVRSPLRGTNIWQLLHVAVDVVDRLRCPLHRHQAGGEVPLLHLQGLPLVPRPPARRGRTPLAGQGCAFSVISRCAPTAVMLLLLSCCWLCAGSDAAGRATPGPALQPGSDLAVHDRVAGHVDVLQGLAQPLLLLEGGGQLARRDVLRLLELGRQVQLPPSSNFTARRWRRAPAGAILSSSAMVRERFKAAVTVLPG